MKKLTLTLCVLTALVGSQAAWAQTGAPAAPAAAPQMTAAQLQAWQNQLAQQAAQLQQASQLQQQQGLANPSGLPVSAAPTTPAAVPQMMVPAAQPTALSAPAAPPSALPPLPSEMDVGIEESGLDPKEIRRLRNVLDARQKAMMEVPNPPKSVTGSVSLSLDPGSTPAVIRPYYGVGTSLVILDSTGSPWPVENFTVGNRQQFQVDRLDGEKGSSFVVVPSQMYGQSNLILKLVGHPTPVVINLIAGQKVHDARIEARVLGRGPNAQVNSVALTPGVDSRLLSVLDGVPPSGRALTVSGDSASKAWVMPDGNVWLRTALTVVSPAPLSFVSSSDGTRVYKLAPAAKVLGMMNGQFLTLELGGCLQECGSGSSSVGW